MTIRSLLKALAVAATLASVVTVATVVPTTTVQAEKAKKQKFFFMLSKGPLETSRAFMALGVAKMLASQGHDVKIFLNLDSVRLVDKRQPLNLKAGMRDNTLEDTFNAFVKAGGTFIACPMCSKTAGLTKENLRQGAIFGNAKIVSKALVEADKVINY